VLLRIRNGKETEQAVKGEGRLHTHGRGGLTHVSPTEVNRVTIRYAILSVKQNKFSWKKNKPRTTSTPNDEEGLSSV